MYLKDIDFDMPYKVRKKLIEEIMVKHGCSYEQAVKKDYEENWKWNIRRRFTLETRCISSMVLRLLGKVKTEDCSKILINCGEEKAKENISSCLGIYTIEYCIDYDNFFLKSDYEKKVITLNIIKDIIEKIVTIKEWDSTPFQLVFQKIIELEYNNSWTFGKKVKSPDKKYTAEIYLEHGIKEIDIFICIRDRNNNIIEKKLIFTELPHEFSYSRHLGKLIWLSGNEVELNNKSGEKLGSVILYK